MDDTSMYTRLYPLVYLLIDNSNFIKDISRYLSEESNSQTELKENIPGSGQVAFGWGTIFSYTAPFCRNLLCHSETC